MSFLGSRRAPSRTTLRFDPYRQTFTVTRSFLDAGQNVRPLCSVVNEHTLRAIGDMDINVVVEQAKFDPMRDHEVRGRRGRQPKGTIAGFSL